MGSRCWWHQLSSSEFAVVHCSATPQNGYQRLYVNWLPETSPYYFNEQIDNLNWSTPFPTVRVDHGAPKGSCFLSATLSHSSCPTPNSTLSNGFTLVYLIYLNTNPRPWVHQSPVGRGTLTAEWYSPDFNLSAVHNTSTWGIRDARAERNANPRPGTNNAVCGVSCQNRAAQIHPGELC